MPFDLATATPVQEQPRGFDLATAKPVTGTQEQPEMTQEQAAEAALRLGGATDSDLQVQPTGAEQQQAPIAIGESPVAEAIGGTVKSAVPGAFGYVGGVFEGLMREIASGEFGTPQAAERISETATKRASSFAEPFLPKNERAREILGEAGELAEQLPVLAPLAAEMQVLSGLAKASAPVLATKFGRNVGFIDPETNLPTPQLQSALDKRGVNFSLVLDDVDNLPVVSRKRDAGEIVDTIIKKKIKSGSDNETLATLRLEGDSIVNDPLGEEAIKQGFRPGDIASAKNTNQATKNRLAEMLNIKRQIKSESSKGIEMRPLDVAGNELMKRIQTIRDRSNILRKDLNKMAEGTLQKGSLGGPGVKPGLKGMEIDTSSVEDAVLTGLEKAKIGIPDEILADTTKLQTYLKNPDAFKGSSISKDKASQKVIRNVVELLSEPGSDAYRAHLIKRQIDTMVDFERKKYGGLTDTGEAFAKSIRRSLNDAIREVSPEYARINDDLSASINAMDNFKKAISSKVDLFDKDTAESAIGQELRKLETNYAARNPIRSSIKNIDQLAKSFGGDYGGVDINKLVSFNYALDDRFMATPRGSFQGGIESAIRSTSMKDLAKQKALDQILERVQKFQNITDDEAFNVMQRILKRKD